MIRKSNNVLCKAQDIIAKQELASTNQNLECKLRRDAPQVLDQLIMLRLSYLAVVGNVTTSDVAID